MYHWHERTIPIKFQLGDWTLFSVPLRVQEKATRAIDESVPQDVLDLPDTPLANHTQAYLFRSVPIGNDLPRVTFVGEYLRYVPLQYQHGYIDLRTSFDAYLKRFSAKSRSTITRKVRRYAEHCGGSIEWRTYKNPDEIREFLHLGR